MTENSINGGERVNKNQTSEEVLAREERERVLLFWRFVADAAGFEQVPFQSCSFIHDDLITGADLKLCFVLNALPAGLIQTVSQLLEPANQHTHMLMHRFKTLLQGGGKKEIKKECWRGSVDDDRNKIYKFQGSCRKGRRQKDTKRETDEIYRRWVREREQLRCITTGIWAERGGSFMCVFACFVAQISLLHVCPVGPVYLFLLSCHTPHEHVSLHPAHTSSHTPDRQRKAMSRMTRNSFSNNKTLF